jgi:1-acyl-sn-glycerol-3-phosphate acyltransferase
MSSIDRDNTPRKPEVNLIQHWLARFIFAVMGWKVEGFVRDYPKMMVVAGPHTANQDGMMLVLASWIVRQKIKWMVKIEMTRGPFGWLIKALGGVGIDRSASFNTVEQVVDEYNSREKFLLVVAPEGTRKKTNHWRTGFYWMAVGAGIPIMFGVLDYKRKVVDLSPPILHPTGDIEADIETIWDIYRPATARVPEKVADMKLRPSGLKSPLEHSSETEDELESDT